MSSETNIVCTPSVGIRARPNPNVRQWIQSVATAEFVFVLREYTLFRTAIQAARRATLRSHLSILGRPHSLFLRLVQAPRDATKQPLAIVSIIAYHGRHLYPFYLPFSIVGIRLRQDGCRRRRRCCHHHGTAVLSRRGGGRRRQTAHPRQSRGGIVATGAGLVRDEFRTHRLSLPFSLPFSLSLSWNASLTPLETILSSLPGPKTKSLPQLQLQQP